MTPRNRKTLVTVSARNPNRAKLYSLRNAGSLSPQNLTLAKHLLRTGSITQREAIMDHSIQSLTKRIAELRAMGIEIESVHRNHPVTGQRYVRYVLAK